MIWLWILLAAALTVLGIIWLGRLPAVSRGRKVCRAAAPVRYRVGRADGGLGGVAVDRGLSETACGRYGNRLRAGRDRKDHRCRKSKRGDTKNAGCFLGDWSECARDVM